MLTVQRQALSSIACSFLLPILTYALRSEAITRGEACVVPLHLRGGNHDCVGLSWGRDKSGYPVLLEGKNDRELTEKQHHHNAVVVKLSHAMREKWLGKDRQQTIGVGRGRKAGNRVHDSAYKKGARMLDFSELNHVLEVDTKKLSVCAEPLVTMEELAAATFALGLLPKVVPEFRHITVGGAIMGAALESSSHRHGQFLDTCSTVSVLLGDGTVQDCSPSKNSDLFHALSGSYGSLAILLQADIQLQPAGPYVRVHYSLSFGVEETTGRLRGLCSKSHANSDPPPEFVEALQLPPSRADAPLTSLIMKSDFANERAGLPIQRFNRHWGLWYYEHTTRTARTLQRSSDPEEAYVEEVVPTLDYLFRYDYGAFWMARPLQAFSPHTKWTPVLPMMFLVSSPLLLVRACVGWLFATKRLYTCLKAAPSSVIAAKMVILDACVPAANAGKLISYIRDNVPISTPLWLCPVAGAAPHQLLAPHGHHSGLMINFGIYGRVCDGRAKEYSVALERQVAELGGRKMLYSQNFYSRDQFWGQGPPWNGVMPQEKTYRRLRNKYKAEGVLVDLFSKVCEAARQVRPSTLWTKLGELVAHMML